jgi:hypothetical protein
MGHQHFRSVRVASNCGMVWKTMKTGDRRVDSE